MLRDPTAHPESAAEIKKKMSARLEIELEMNTYIQDYVYTLKGVGGEGHGFDVGYNPVPAIQTASSSRQSCTSKKERKKR